MLLATAGAIALPGAPAQAAAPPAPPVAVNHVVGAVKDHYVARTMTLARRLAHVRGTDVRPGYRRALRSFTLPKLTRQQRHLRHRLRHARAEARTAAAVPPQLQAIAACESGGDPHAVGGGGTFRGKYQFTYATWAAVGGSGDPAAAPEAEQDRRAAALYAQAGPGQWPVCGR
jgi:hypothetical protein